MIRSDQILKTVSMIQKEHLDLRTITMGIDLLDCRCGNVSKTCDAVERKIKNYAKDLVKISNEVGEEYGIPVVNKRISITPLAHVCAGFDAKGYVAVAKAIDRAADAVKVDFVGGYSCNVEKGMSKADEILIESIPEAMFATKKICSSVNVAGTKSGVNMDAVKILGEVIKKLAAGSAKKDGFACAKLVIFANQPGDNPFMAGAIHGHGEPECVINVGVSGPGVVARALERKIKDEGVENLRLDDLAEEIKLTSFRVTRCGELLGRQIAKRLEVPFGVVDLSLAPTPVIGDSVGEILKILGVDEIGAPGSTAIVALLNDAVKKGGAFASQSVGGLSGAFIPVCEDAELSEAVRNGSLSLEKLEAMTSVCSVGLDMIAIPGNVDAATISAIIADEMAIGVINRKTTAVRLIPVPGKKPGDIAVFGGLFGSSAVLTVRNAGKSKRFIAWGGKIPAPIHSLNN
jgi:uncharacterized protein (UPF0210 family)